MTILYFAYGSNMLTERLVRRCASARVIGRASLAGHAIAFSKIGRDGTGKATLVVTGEAATHAHGVVFEMGREDIETLDRIEGRGRGYHRIEPAAVTLHACGSRIDATTYIAEPHHVAAGLTPFDWYRDLVIAGARQHCLPQPHIDWLAALPVLRDDNAARDTRREALEILSEISRLLSARG